MPSVDLLCPGRIDGFDTRNRMFMAPMTRSRALAGGVPSDVAIEDHAQRASAGLIISEGTAPAATGIGYARTPSIDTPEQIAAWKRITDAVHARGGRISCNSCTSVASRTRRIVTSAIRLSRRRSSAPPARSGPTRSGCRTSTRRARSTPSEIPGVIAQYAQATTSALAAGFDGVELHSASGYLPMQFLSTGSNRRTDGYGGSVRSRIRFVVETLEAMAAAAGGASRVGIKISPAMPFNDIHDDDPIETYTTLVKAIAPMGLAYLHVLRTPPLPNIFQILRPLFSGPFAAGGGFEQQSGNAMLESGGADVIVFGKLFTSNPDLPDRFAAGAPLTPFDASTFYTPGPKGYVDFPAMSGSGSLA